MEQFFPGSDIFALATAISDVTDDVADVMAIAADAMDVLANFVIDEVDPIAILVDAIIEEIQRFVGDLRATASLLPVVPKDRYTKGGIEGFLGAVSRSFDDTADGDRPQFSPSAEVVGYVFAYGATDLAQLYEQFLLKATPLFDTGAFEDWKWSQFPDYVPPRTERQSSGKPPDWESIRVADVFPPYDDLLGELEKMAYSLGRGNSTSDFVRDMATTIRNKAQQLEQLSWFIDFFANQVEDLFQLDNIWYVKVGPVKGIENWRAELLSASNRPPYKGEFYYVTGIAALAGGPSVEALEALLG